MPYTANGQWYPGAATSKTQLPAPDQVGTGDPNDTTQHIGTSTTQLPAPPPIDPTQQVGTSTSNRPAPMPGMLTTPRTNPSSIAGLVNGVSGAVNKNVVAQNDAQAAAAAPQTEAQTSILKNQVATTAPGYVSATDQAAINSKKAELAEASRAALAGEQLTARQQDLTKGSTDAQLAEQAREATASQGLAQEQQTFAETQAGKRQQMLQGLLDTIKGSVPGGAPPAPIGTAPGPMTTGGMQPAPEASTGRVVQPAPGPASTDPTQGVMTSGGPATPTPTPGGMIGTAGGQLPAPGPGNVPGSGTPGTPGAPAMSPYDMAAENAAYGAAKENTGNEAQSAMKGLDAAMAARGITGSGIQAANTRGIFEKGIGEQAGTDRSLAENRSSRVFAAQQAQKQMDEMQREFNLNLSATERNQMIQALIGAAGLY